MSYKSYFTGRIDDAPDLVSIPVSKEMTITLRQYKCEKHGDIKQETLSFFISGEQYGKRLCSKCYWDFMEANCCEAEEVQR